MLLAGTSPAAAGDEAALLVAHKWDDDVAFVDLASGEVGARIETGADPHEVVLSPDGRRAYVSNYGPMMGGDPGTTLSVIDVEARERVGTIDVSPHTRPHGLVVSRDGSLLWATAEGSQSVLEIQLTTGKVVRTWKTDQETSHMLVTTPGERKLYVSNIGSGTTSVVDRETDEVRHLETGAGSEGIAISPDGREVWVASRSDDTIAVIDTETDEIEARFDSGASTPMRIAFHPTRAEAWVAHLLSSSVVVVSTKNHEVLAEIDVPGGFLPIPGPVGITFDGAGARAYVAHVMADHIAVLDVTKRTLVDTIDVGDHPDGMAWIAGGPK